MEILLKMFSIFSEFDCPNTPLSALDPYTAQWRKSGFTHRGFSVAARAERLSCSYEEKTDSVLTLDRRKLERLLCPRKLKDGRETVKRKARWSAKTTK